jgi:hypothetical protein
VTGNPANVGDAGIPVLGMDIEDVLEGQGSTEKVTTGGVDNTFWLASGSRGLKRSRFAFRQGC